MPLFHVDRLSDGAKFWEEIDLTIARNEDYSGIHTTRFLVYDAADPDHLLGQIERHANYTTFQVYDRIRYDNKPITVWRAVPSPPGLYDDPRTEAIANVLGLSSQFDIHLAHRPPSWVTCPLHNS